MPLNLDSFSVFVCRGVGLALLLFGLSTLLPMLTALIFGPTTELMDGVRVSWTRYAPPQFTFGQLLRVALRANLAVWAQAGLSLVLLVFSRGLGPLLAAGLLDRPA